MAKEKVLIILPNWIGDVVMSLPVLDKSRELFPNNEIKILIKEEIFPLIKENCRILNIWPIFYNKKDFQNSIALIKKIRKEHFDIAFILPRSERMSIVSIFSKIKYKYGHKSFLNYLFCKKTVANIDKHRVDFYSDILKLYKNFENSNFPELKLSIDVKRWALNFLEKNKIKNKILIGLNPGATYGEAKCWDIDNFILLCKNLITANPNIFFLIFGGKDNQNNNKIFDNFKYAINLTGKLTLDQSAALIEQCRVFVTNDTGPMHIADALNVSIVALFGPTDPKETPPYKRREHIIYKNLNCSPCKERRCPKEHNNCMRYIKVEDVIYHINHIINCN